MSSKVKSFLKGLKYISQIFLGSDEKEEEIQIGVPTDVKHVAHIGSDDPGQNAPSWMNEYKEANPSEAANATEKPGEKTDSPKRKEKSKVRHLIPKSRHDSIDESNPTKKTTRRHHRSSDPSADSTVQDSSSGGSRYRRRRGSNQGSESPSTEVPPSGAKAPRRKAKNSEDSSEKKRSSRRSSKGNSLTDSEFGSGSIPESENGPK